MSSFKSSWTRRVTLTLLAIGGALGALAVACGGGDPEIVTVVETVEKPVVIQTVERQVTQIEKVIETVVVEREVTRTEKVVETVVVEKVVEGQTVKVIETVIVDRPVTRTEKVDRDGRSGQAGHRNGEGGTDGYCPPSGGCDRCAAHT